MEIMDIVKSMSGKDQSGEAKSAITLSSIVLDIDTEEIKNERTLSSHAPVVNIEGRSEFVQIDLIFKSCLDTDLRSMWLMLEAYGKQLSNYGCDDFEEPIAILNIVPIEHKGRYYAVVKNPIFWVLQPEKPGMQANVIRMMFYENDFSIFESSEIDFDKVKGDIEREMTTQSFMEEMAEKKEREKAEYTEYRNKIIEDGRKKTFRY